MLKKIIFASFSFLLAFQADLIAEEHPCGRKIKIGVTLPLTVSTVATGESGRKSILLAKALYDKHRCVEFIFEDDQLLGKKTLTAVQRFLSQEHVDGLITFGTPTSLAVSSFVESRQVPMIALSIFPKVVEGKSFIMKHWCTAESLTQAVVAEVKRRGYKRVAIVSTQNDAALLLRDLFLEAKVSEVPLDEEYVREESDFSSFAARIAGARIDAVYNILFPPQVAPFSKRLREQGFRGDIFGVHNLEDPSEVQASDGALIGSWFVNGDGTVGEGFTAKYREKYGEYPAFGAANAFDAAKMFIESAYQSKDVNSYLHSLTNFHGAFGSYNATKRNDFDYPAAVKIVGREGFHSP